MTAMEPNSAETDFSGQETEAPRSWWRWLAGSLLLLVLALAAAVPLGLWYLAETPGGRAFVARQLSGLEPESGIRYDVGRIDGSLLSSFQMVDVVVKDLDGTLAVLPLVDVRWNPATLFGNLVSVERIIIPEMRFLRMWRLNPRDPDDPLLPAIDIRIDRFAVERLVVEKALAGRREVLSASGRADIRAGRLLMDLKADAESGDALTLLLDAEPDGDRFDLDARLDAPAGGLLASAAGLDRALILKADGNGTWARWRGRLLTSLGNGDTAETLVDINLGADGGRFRATGALRPAPLLEGPLAALGEPDIALDAIASAKGDIYELRLVASSTAFALTAGGGLDPRENRLHAAVADVVLKEPGRIDPALSGETLRARLEADGPLAGLEIGWTASAGRIRFDRADRSDGSIGIDDLRASGAVTLAKGDDPLRATASATAGALAGLPPEFAAIVASPRLSGALSFADGVLTIEQVDFDSARLKAGGKGRMLADGRLTADFDASLARYDIDGLGPVTLSASGRLDKASGAAPRVAGRFQGRTLALANDAVARFLGGNPALSGDFALAASGLVAATNVRLQSPKLTLAGSRASYDPESGRFTLAASGASTDYGPLVLTASGTPAAPTARLAMERPGLGVGLQDLVADIAPDGSGRLRVTARGTTPQGPLDGRALITLANGQPLTLDVERLFFAGLEARGRLVQTAAGPFAGDLVVDGQGLDLRLRLAGQGGIQRVDGRAGLVNSRLPLPTPISINNGSARFRLLLVPDRPHLTGSFRLTGLRRGNLVLTRAEGSANIAGASGLAKLAVSGRAGDGKRLQASLGVQSVSDGYALSLDGRLGDQPLRLTNPARIARTADGWQLKPVRLQLQKGEVLLSGNWGKSSNLQLSLKDVDLSVVDLYAADSGLGGTASGRLDLRLDGRSAIPAGTADLDIRGLQRSGLGAEPVPVDVRLSAQSDGAALRVGANLSWQGNRLGRLVLRVDPGAGDSPQDRFLSGALSGGVRYNGPVEPLWALAAPEGQVLKGPIAIGADFAGTPGAPSLAGIARGSGIVYRNVQFGTEITDIAFNGRFSNASLVLASITARANGGTLSGSGVVRLDADSDRMVDISARLDKARLANSDTMQVTVSGPVRLQGEGGTATLSGDLKVDSARIQLMQVETSEIPQLKVRRAGEVRVPEPESSFAASRLNLDVRIRADDRVRVEGMGLDSFWGADVRIRGTARDPRLVGSANLVRGDFQFAGSDFDITRGRVIFNGAPLDSAIDIQAQTVAQDVTAIVTIAGTAARPDVRFTSTPSLPQDEILSRLLFGTSVADLSVTEAVQLATAIAGLQSGVDTMGKIRRSVGLDRLRLVGDNSDTGMGTGLAIGKRLSRNLYAEVLTDAQGNTLTSVQVTLSRVLSILADVSSLGRSSVNLRYQREY